MSNLQAGLFTLLTNEPTIFALIGTRLYPITLPENPTLPAIRYTVVGGMSMPTFETSGMNRWRFQFDCYGATADDAMTDRKSTV